MEIFVRPADRQDAVKLMGLLFQLQDESSTFMLEQDMKRLRRQMKLIILIFADDNK